jgi:hypothetical protein
MAHADRLVYLNQLQVKGLRSDDIQVLGQLPCLIYLRLKAKKSQRKTSLSTQTHSLAWSISISPVSCHTWIYIFIMEEKVQYT